MPSVGFSPERRRVPRDAAGDRRSVPGSELAGEAGEFGELPPPAAGINETAAGAPLLHVPPTLCGAPRGRVLDPQQPREAAARGQRQPSARSPERSCPRSPRSRSPRAPSAPQRGGSGRPRRRGEAARRQLHGRPWARAGGVVLSGPRVCRAGAVSTGGAISKHFFGTLRADSPSSEERGSPGAPILGKEPAGRADRKRRGRSASTAAPFGSGETRGGRVRGRGRAGGAGTGAGRPQVRGRVGLRSGRA